MAEAHEDQTNAEAAILVREQRERVKRLGHIRTVLQSNEENQRLPEKQPVSPPRFRVQPISVAGERLRKITGEPSPEPPKQPETPPEQPIRRTPQEIIRAAYEKPLKPGKITSPSTEGTGVSPLERARKQGTLPGKIIK
jgi:hypothetical protein